LIVMYLKPDKKDKIVLIPKMYNAQSTFLNLYRK
jgi:hypothetical protein